MHSIKKIAYLLWSSALLFSHSTYANPIAGTWDTGVVQKVVLQDRFIVMNSIRYYVPNQFLFHEQNSATITLAALTLGKKIYFTSKRIPKNQENPLYLYQLKHAYILPDDYVLPGE